MYVTLRELAATLNPPITPDQLNTLAIVARIMPTGTRRTGQHGRPPRLYDATALTAAHAEEAARTSRQFTDSDWLAHALIARERVHVDTDAGQIWWADSGERAERLHRDNYGWIRILHEQTPAHRLIWIAAEGEIPPRLQINHRNGLRWDNRRANLELVTFIHNIRHGRGEHYLTHHQAAAELAADPGPSAAPTPRWSAATRVGGVFRLAR